MKVDVNLWAILLAGVSSMIIGMIYYMDSVLGKEWKEAAKIDNKRFEKEMPRVMPWVFVGALVTAYVVAYVTFLYHQFFNDSWLRSGVVTALILWLGLSATSLFIHGVLEQRRRSLIVIALGNRLLSILAMGLIIGWLHP